MPEAKEKTKYVFMISQRLSSFKGQGKEEKRVTKHSDRLGGARPGISEGGRK